MTIEITKSKTADTRSPRRPFPEGGSEMTKPTPRKMRFKTPQPPHDEDKYCVMAGCVPVEPPEPQYQTPAPQLSDNATKEPGE